MAEWHIFHYPAIVGFIYKCRGAKLAAPFRAFFGQNMAFARAVTDDFARCGDLKPLGH